MRYPFFVLVNSIVAFLVFFSFTNYTNTVPFAGDSVEYQSAAVNYVYGNGFMEFGGIEDFGAYNFELRLDDATRWDKDFFYEIVHFDTINPPSYSFFISLVYKLFGINPYYLKLIQLMLICIGASMLIPISQLLFKNNGFIIGFAASLLFIFSTYTCADKIYAEPLLIFLFAFFCYFWLNYKIKKDKMSFYFAILFLALCVLSKGIFYFVFGLIAVFELIDLLKGKRINQLKKFIVLIVGVPLLISPYVLWQNYHINQKEIKLTSYLIQLNHQNKFEDYIIKTQGITKEKIEKDKKKQGITNKYQVDLALLKDLISVEIIPNWVTISSQGDYVLLTSNSEYSLDGDWHPESVNDTASFYNSINPNLPSYYKVYLFYTTHPENILPTFLNKFKRVFWLYSNSRMLLLLSITMLITSFFKKFKIKRIVLLVLLLLSFSFSFVFKESFYTFLGNNSILLFMLSLIAFIGLFVQLKKYKLAVLIPFALSPIMVSLVFYGYFRIIMPYFLIISVLSVYLFIESLYAILGSRSKTT